MYTIELPIRDVDGAARVPRSVRQAAGRAAALARRFRPPPGRGRAAREARPPPRHPLADAPGPRAPQGPEASRRQRPPARAGRRLGPRPALVARPDDPNAPAARRAHGPRLARLVRDLPRGRRLGPPDAETERALPEAGPRVVPEPRHRGHARPGDAALALGHRQLEGLAERKLRARADGALH